MSVDQKTADNPPNRIIPPTNDEQPMVFTHPDGNMESDSELSDIDDFDDELDMSQVKNELVHEKENTDNTDTDSKDPIKKESIALASSAENQQAGLSLSLNTVSNNASSSLPSLATSNSNLLSNNLLQAQSSLLLSQALLNSPNNILSPGNKFSIPNLQASLAQLQSSSSNSNAMDNNSLLNNCGYPNSAYNMQSQLAAAMLASRSMNQGHLPTLSQYNNNALANALKAGGQNQLHSLPFSNTQLQFAQLEAERAHLKRKREEEERKRMEDERPHIKKPLNAFMLYMKEQRQQVVQECTLKESAAINQILGRKWHSLTKEEQQKYYDKAREAREKHNALYPQWSARDNYGKRKKRKKERQGITDANQAKKCRAVYGLEAQHLWCAPCRRKKKCIRFLDDEDRLALGQQDYGNMHMLGGTPNAAALAAAVGNQGMGGISDINQLNGISEFKTEFNQSNAMFPNNYTNPTVSMQGGINSAQNLYNQTNMAPKAQEIQPPAQHHSQLHHLTSLQNQLENRIPSYQGIPTTSGYLSSLTQSSINGITPNHSTPPRLHIKQERTSLSTESFNPTHGANSLIGNNASLPPAHNMTRLTSSPMSNQHAIPRSATPTGSHHSDANRTPVGTPTHTKPSSVSSNHFSNPATPTNCSTSLAAQSLLQLNNASTMTNIMSPSAMQLTANAIAAQAQAQAAQAKAEAMQAQANAAQAAAAAASSLPPNSPIAALLAAQQASPHSNYNPQTPNTPTAIHESVYASVLHSPLSPFSINRNPSLHTSNSTALASAVAALTAFNQQPGSNNSHTSSGFGPEPISSNPRLGSNNDNNNALKFLQCSSNHTSGKGETTSSNVSPGSGTAINVDSAESCDSGTSPKRTDSQTNNNTSVLHNSSTNTVIEASS